ncbi:pappalysin-2 [Fistulifera solaris]|uniref:Pappalysin-2 n=1 Tax=Fistulifera solaris TaxID=1519565 RepID=A0A1Z5K209_FISSO|nr:pappalysin-2 [Fistulifera solaris]|eukprot:GAX20209.1 pappalysin-2 [Fistulifera solaris]
MKFIHIANLFTILAVTAVAHERHLAEEHRCGTKDPDDSDLKAREYAQEYRAFLAERNDEYRAPLIEVPVCFHIPRRAFLGGERISNEQLQDELDHLNMAYSAASCCDASLSECSGRCSPDTGISFVMAKLDGNGNFDGVTDSVSSPNACVTRPRQRRWVRFRFLGADGAMKEALRKGDERVLNVYYTNLPGNTLGYATFPWDYDSFPKDDGVVMSRDTIRGGAPPYNEGDTLVHEVGHWLGLYHTFDSACSPGDRIADTAPERVPYYGCNPSEQRDTCTGDLLKDPIFNFMDYSDDKCLFEFTAGQISAMVDSYVTYRTPGSRRMLKPIHRGLREIGSLEAGATQVFQMNDVPMSSVVHCHAEIAHEEEEGHLDLFMNSHGRLNDFECSSEDREAHQCSLMAIADSIYVIAHAKLKISEFTIVCAINDDEWLR